MRTDDAPGFLSDDSQHAVERAGAVNREGGISYLLQQPSVLALALEGLCEPFLIELLRGNVHGHAVEVGRRAVRRVSSAAQRADPPN